MVNWIQLVSISSKLFRLFFFYFKEDCDKNKFFGRIFGPIFLKLYQNNMYSHRLSTPIDLKQYWIKDFLCFKTFLFSIRFGWIFHRNSQELIKQICLTNIKQNQIKEKEASFWKKSWLCFRFFFDFDSIRCTIHGYTQTFPNSIFLNSHSA